MGARKEFTSLQTRNKMKTIIVLLALIFMSCSGLSWQTTSNGYTYFNNRVSGCEAPYPKTPMKKTNYNTQAYYWQRR